MVGVCCFSSIDNNYPLFSDTPGFIRISYSQLHYMAGWCPLPVVVFLHCFVLLTVVLCCLTLRLHNTTLSATGAI